MRAETILRAALCIAILTAGVGAVSTSRAADPAIAAQTLQFDIKPQPLASALNALALQSHQQILFTPEIAKGKTTQGVKGALTADAALDQLLVGTGLSSSRSADGMILVSQADAKGASASSGPSSAPVGASNDQSPNKNTSIQEDSGRLEEVMVTAQKRHEDLQEVPISVQVIGGQTLTRQNLNSLGDLAQTAPSLHISANGRSDNIYLRGIGTQNNGSLDQPVGTFVDDIYHGRSRNSGSTFLDLERVEILKGPQSTFFGNNAIAGALNIVTRKPGDEFDSWGRALYGMHGQYAAEGAVGGPITDKIALRAAMTFNGRSGWIKNVGTGKDHPDERNLSGRVTAVFRPTDDLDATLKIEGSKDRGDTFGAQQVVNCPPPAPLRPRDVRGCPQALALGIPIGLDNDLNDNLPGQGTDLHTTDDVLTVNLQRWNHTFTSVSGFYDYRYDMHLDAVLIPTPDLASRTPENYRQWSQELRVESPVARPIEYLVGTYFQTDHLHIDQNLNFFSLTPVIAANKRFAALVPYLPLAQDINYGQDEDSYAIFGSATWNTTERLKLTGGLRGSWVHKKYNQNLTYGTASPSLYGTASLLPAALQQLPPALGLGNLGPLSGNRTDQAWMPSAKIQYQINTRAMAYFSYTRGFLAGGFNAADSSGAAANLPFGPEYVDAYEVGLKSKWIDDRLLVNLALFRGNYRDLQVSTGVFDSATGALTNRIRNAASARSQGAEFAGQWLVTEQFRLSADIAYLDARYGRFPNAFASTFYKITHPGAQLQDLSGSRRPFAPPWSGSVKADYSTTLPWRCRFTTELSTYFSSSFYRNPLDQWAGRYTRLDGRLSLENPDGSWAIDLVGKNLTDAIIAGSIVGTNPQVKQEPRNVALQVRLEWGRR